MERSLVVMACTGAGALKSIGRRDMESFFFSFREWCLKDMKKEGVWRR